MNIIYKEIDKNIEEQIVKIWGDWVIKYGCLHYGEGCYSLAALVDGVPVGFCQLRSWSSDDKVEAIPMWYALGYGVCPAIMRGVSVIEEFVGKPIYGFYVSKVL